ncbi:hypothetical protein ACA910_007351 [Epithemia clementina (nom. ined.)]
MYQWERRVELRFPLLAKLLVMLRHYWRGVCCIVIVIVSLVLLCLRHKLLGNGPTLQGGSIGRRVDNSIKSFLFHLRDWQYRRDFAQTMGYPVPSCPESTANRKGVPVLLSTSYTEVLVRAQIRSQWHQQVAESSLCGFSEYEELNQNDESRRNKTFCIFQPLLGDWFRPLSMDRNTSLSSLAAAVEFVVIPYLESEMDRWMLQHYSSNWAMVDLYQSFLPIDRAQFWGLCMIWEHGGAFLGARTNHWVDALRILLDSTVQPQRSMAWKREAHNSNILSHVLAKKSRPAELRCVMELLAMASNITTFAHILALLEKTQDCEGQGDCCRYRTTLNNQETGGFESSYNEHQRRALPTMPRLDIAIVEKESEQGGSILATTEKTAKLSHAEQMKKSGCTPGWFCNRCLKMPWRGSLSRCLHFCHACYVEQITKNETGSLRQVEMEVRVRPNNSPVEPTRVQNHLQRIPHIIHQTWFEELSVETYPHFSRLQNSWKASGWDYRFYTDDTARAYIQQHFPLMFVEAYDALLPAAFKADFFRLLVLLKDGGIYADVDVQLDITNLDHFVTSNLSFVVPRDVPIDRWPDSNYCLWNGFMAASPGHPIVVQAAQDLLNRIQNRWDYYDVENALCSETMDCEIWKLRSIPVLLLTGPCALGISVNTALGRTNKVQGLELGWLAPNRTFSYDNDDDWGDGLVLLTDKYDLGELRFSDVDRALLVASTDADKTITSPLVDTTIGKMDGITHRRQQQGAHYSKSETDIMGSSGLYVDNLISNLFVKMTIHHSKVLP